MNLNNFTIKASEVIQQAHPPERACPDAKNRDPKEIIAEMSALDAESAEILAGIERML